MVKDKSKNTVYAVVFVVSIFVIVSILFVNSLQPNSPVGSIIPVIDCPDGYSESRECVFLLDANICDNCLVPVCQLDSNPQAQKLSCGTNIGDNNEYIYVGCSQSIVGSCDVP